MTISFSVGINPSEKKITVIIRKYVEFDRPGERSPE